MVGFESMWMVPVGIILCIVGLVAVGYGWGVFLDIKQRLTNGSGETNER